MGVVVQKILWLRGLEEELMGKYVKPIKLFCHNQSAIQLAMNESYKSRTKHIDARHHFIRDNILSKKVFAIQPTSSKDMVADILIKPLSNIKANIFLNCMGLKMN